MPDNQDIQRRAHQLDLLRGLRSIRHFLPTPVPAAAIDDMLAVARWSGSARNRQHWELIVIQERATLRALAGLEGHAAHLANAPLGLLLVMNGELEEQETFDEGKVSERIMLAAAVHGLGSCIGWFRDSGRTAAKEQLGIPPERLVRTVISIGYPDLAAHQARNRPPQARKALSELVSWERYGQRL